MSSGPVQADVCIIGCGPAGITLSRDLVAAGLRVAMLESGELDDTPAARELRQGRAEGPVIKDYGTYLTDSRRFQVVGSGGGWGRGARIWCVPFSPIDFRTRSWVSHSGWPFEESVLRPYVDRAATAMGTGRFAASIPVVGSPGRLVVHAYHYPVDSGVFRRDFHTLCADERFRVELGTTAMAFSVRQGQVQAVRARRSNGEDFWVEASNFVLAAGGIENARILMLQNSLGPDSTIAQSDALGRYFMEHFHVYAGTVRFADRVPWNEYLTTTVDPVHGYSWMRILGFDDEVQEQERLLNASIQLTGDPPDDDKPTADESPTWGLMVRAEQAPDPHSRVVLGEDRDALGRQRAVLHWEVQDQNWDSVIRAASLANAELTERHGAKSRILIRRDAPWPWSPAGPAFSPRPTWGNHHMGTTRMHDDPALGVVDRDCRVHGTANLFVAGSSTFPTSSFANPTITIVALAIRLAAHIMELYQD